MRNEIKNSTSGDDALNQELAQEAIEYRELDEWIKSKRMTESMPNALFPFARSLISCREQLLLNLSKYSAKSLQDFLIPLGSHTIYGLISRRAILKSKITDYETHFESLPNDITSEMQQCSEYVKQLPIEEAKKSKVSDSLTQLQGELEQICNKLSVKSIAELTHDCNYETIEDLISRRQILAQEIATLTEEVIEPLRSSLYTLTNES